MKPIIVSITLFFINFPAFAQTCAIPDNITDPSIPGIAVELPVIDASMREFMNLRTFRGGIYLTNQNQYVVSALIYFKDGVEQSRILLGARPRGKEELDYQYKSKAVPRVLDIELILKVEVDVTDGMLNQSLSSAYLRIPNSSKRWENEWLKKFPDFVTLVPKQSGHPFRENPYSDVTSIHGYYDDFAICCELRSSKRRKVVAKEFEEYPVVCTRGIKTSILNSQEAILLGIYVTDDYDDLVNQWKKRKSFQ